MFSQKLQQKYAPVCRVIHGIKLFKLYRPKLTATHVLCYYQLKAVEEKLNNKRQEADELTIALTAKSAEVEELYTLLTAQKQETQSLEKFNVSS